uniref:Uncharacterized protein n=1 Tax=Caldisericum exile TaxID=693075 RepID=A0A7C4Y4X7_9BACT
MAKNPKKPKTISKDFEILLSPWEGMVTSQDAYTIPETMSVWIEGLPKLTGAIEGVLKPEVKYTHDSTILDYFVFWLSNEFHAILDGNNLTFLDTSFNSVGSFASSDSKCDYALQGNTAVWVVTRNFLITFDGTTVYNLTGRSVLGDTICYWKGRIFIGKDRTITFSVPDPDYTNATNPFDTSAGAGYIIINIGSFNRILGLIPKEDSIYILTDNNILALLGTTISNDPTQWYLAEVISGYGVTGIRKWVKYEHTIYYHSNIGIVSIIATAPEKIDDAITNITGTIDGISYFVYDGIPYIAILAESFFSPPNKAIYCYNLLFKKWFALSLSFSVISSYQNLTYGVQEKSISKFFASGEYLPIKVKTKTFFNLDQLYYNLRTVYLYGRGNNNVSCKIYDETSRQVEFNYNQMGLISNAFLFSNSYGNFLFYNNTGHFLFAQTPGFFLNTYKQHSINYQGQRMKQFSLLLESEDLGVYTEFINLKVKGTLGARYV